MLLNVIKNNWKSMDAKKNWNLIIHDIKSNTINFVGRINNATNRGCDSYTSKILSMQL